MLHVNKFLVLLTDSVTVLAAVAMIPVPSLLLGITYSRHIQNARARARRLIMNDSKSGAPRSMGTVASSESA